MITGDLDVALGPQARTAGTWRPPPCPGPPGTYATSVAYEMARWHGADPAAIAGGLAARLTPLGWVASARVTGGGYVTVTVTPEALAALAPRIARAGPACAHSGALAGATLTAARDPRLETASSWEEARRRLTGSLTGRLARAAGACVAWTEEDASRPKAPDPPATPHCGGVAGAIAYAGADAITYTLARLSPGAPVEVDAGLAAVHRLGNPAYAVRYAHALAASALRQAADLGLGPGDAAGFQPRLLAHPRELSLLYSLSWLPEQAGGAARRGQPGVLARYLERVAAQYLGCAEQCPAVRPGWWHSPAVRPGYPHSRAAPPGVPTAQTAAVSVARLWLAAAVRTTLAAGLDLLNVSAPDRL